MGRLLVGEGWEGAWGKCPQRLGLHLASGLTAPWLSQREAPLSCSAALRSLASLGGESGGEGSGQVPAESLGHHREGEVGGREGLVLHIATRPLWG